MMKKCSIKLVPFVITLFLLSACAKGIETVESVESKIDITETTATATIETELDEETLIEELEGTALIEATTSSNVDTEIRMSAYREALMILRSEFIWPDSLEAEHYSDDISVNQFSVCDVDYDGKEELVVKWTTASMAGTMMRIFEYNPSVETWNIEYWGNPYDHFYSDGTIISDWSHNQGYAASIWPYSVYRYDSLSDEYVYLGAVDCWDRIVTDFNPDVVFPEEYDTDNAGVVYMITFEGYESEYYSQSDYDAFYSMLLGQTEEVDIQFYDLTEDNISSVCGEYCFN